MRPFNIFALFTRLLKFRAAKVAPSAEHLNRTIFNWPKIRPVP